MITQKENTLYMIVNNYKKIVITTKKKLFRKKWQFKYSLIIDGKKDAEVKPFYKSPFSFKFPEMAKHNAEVVLEQLYIEGKKNFKQIQAKFRRAQKRVELNLKKAGLK